MFLLSGRKPDHQLQVVTTAETVNTACESVTSVTETQSARTCCIFLPPIFPANANFTVNVLNVPPLGGSVRLPLCG